MRSGPSRSPNQLGEIRKLDIKPFRDRPVSTRSVACPSCKAEPEQLCVKQDGSPTKTCHPHRRRSAIRQGL